MTTHHSIPKLKFKLHANNISNYALRFYLESTKKTCIKYTAYDMRHIICLHMCFNVWDKIFYSPFQVLQNYLRSMKQVTLDRLVRSYLIKPRISLRFKLRRVFSYFVHDIMNDILSLLLEKL